MNYPELKNFISIIKKEKLIMQKIYEVKFSYSIIVAAKNEDEAEDKALKRWKEDAPTEDEMNIDVIDTGEVVEKDMKRCS